MLLPLHVGKKGCATPKGCGGEEKALLCLVVECCGQHIPMQSCILRCLYATLCFKWVFKLFDINGSTVKCLIRGPKGTDRADALQFMVEEVSLSLTKDCNVL